MREEDVSRFWLYFRRESLARIVSRWLLLRSIATNQRRPNEVMTARANALEE